MDKKDFYFENNCIVLTESFLKKRGFCCHNNCRHCPYKGSKMRYFLHTSNDLIFEFDHDEKVWWIDNNYMYQSSIQDLEYHKFPLVIDMDEEEYTIISFRKIQQ